MRILDIPSEQRPRERALAGDIESLSDAELVALVLRQGTRSENALTLAYGLLTSFGSLSALGRAQVRDLVTSSGMGMAKSAALTAAFELSRRMRSHERHESIGSGTDVARIVTPMIGNLARERLLVLVCDAGDALKDVIRISDGALDCTLLPVREVLNAVVRVDGRAFAIAHNHPSGDPTPSEHDRSATRRLRTAAAIVGVRMLDHVVVAGDRWRSVD